MVYKNMLIFLLGQSYEREYLLPTVIHGRDMAMSRHSHPGHGAAWTWVERPPDRGTLLSILRLIDNCAGEARGQGRATELAKV